MATSITERERAVRTPKEFGEALSEVRAHRNSTQAEVANLAGIDRSQLAHMEGGRAGRYLENVFAILGHLGAVMSISWNVDPPDPEESEPILVAQSTEHENRVMHDVLKLTDDEMAANAKLLKRLFPDQHDGS